MSNSKYYGHKDHHEETAKEKILEASKFSAAHDFIGHSNPVSICFVNIDAVFVILSGGP